jgi:hypothetical protein
MKPTTAFLIGLSIAPLVAIILWAAMRKDACGPMPVVLTDDQLRRARRAQAWIDAGGLSGAGYCAENSGRM